MSFFFSLFVSSNMLLSFLELNLISIGGNIGDRVC